MKPTVLPASAALLFFVPCVAPAQVVPTTPTKFSTRPVGAATATSGATISPPAKSTSFRQVTYLTLSPLRQWNSADGKSLIGKLIAWEETITTTKGTPAPSPLSAPITTKPTVIRGNNVRLLIENKAYEVPLDRLGVEEQKFIHDLEKTIAAKP